ncbi:MAG TPA: chorismate synthase [bacterium]|nr:chorismate synthase [bacterium]
MQKLRFLTAGESHGQGLVTILEGMPAGVPLTAADITPDLKRRQRGYGRGGRMQIEKDAVRILSGVRYGRTLGSPISMFLENLDWPNWTEKMAPEMPDHPVAALHMPRPGHADFAGMVKYRQEDLRNILERSSARETAARVAAGAVARTLLAAFGIAINSHVISIRGIQASISAAGFFKGRTARDPELLASWRTLMARVESSPLACADAEAEARMIAAIDAAREKGDTLGGVVEIVALGLFPGLGSHVHWDRRLDAMLAGALMSIPAIKGVEIGLGFGVTLNPGSQIHDEIFHDPGQGFYRGGNNAGGIEGGMSNGEPLVLRVHMKPLPTLARPLRSIDVATLQPQSAHHERADVCAVPAAAVVAEAMTALILADALCVKLGGDSLSEMQQHYASLAHVPLGW